MKPPPSLSNLSLTLLVFVSCNILLLINNDSKPKLSEKTETAFEPISFMAWRLSAIAMAYLSSMIYHGINPSLENLLNRMQKSWKQTAITMVYIELINTASVSLLLMLSSAAKAAKGFASEAAVIAGAVYLISWLGPVLFVHSDAAYKISLIVSVEEEGCKGEKALERAGDLVKERKVVGYVLMLVTIMVEQAMSKMFRRGSAVSLAQLLAMFFTYFVYTSFYYECKKKSRVEGGKEL
ncbi:hypothetical protein IEQ34_021355 [Dendrobium chrysotoxum]|uniref:Uncharacterized protein n=1 Tax=Dendrobium chrysotoxum TaxID=161865 RepID=A0AAV7G5M8_DENCH|nr:hypothetical protein IEQ34_021355 [Dendrobium chrysotoxum]